MEPCRLRLFRVCAADVEAAPLVQYPFPLCRLYVAETKDAADRRRAEELEQRYAYHVDLAEVATHISVGRSTVVITPRISCPF